VRRLDPRDVCRVGRLPVLGAEGILLEREETEVQEETTVAVLGQTGLVGSAFDVPLEELLDGLEEGVAEPLRKLVERDAGEGSKGCLLATASLLERDCLNGSHDALVRLGRSLRPCKRVTDPGISERNAVESGSRRRPDRSKAVHDDRPEVG
jgi:hypothetical protein